MGRGATVGFLALLLALGAGGAVMAQEPSGDWPVELVDPGAEGGDAADLLLPMPCGAFMAFQRVDVPSDPNDPLSVTSDFHIQRLRIGIQFA